MSALGGGGAEKVLIDYLKRFDRSKFQIDLCLVIKQGIYLSEVPNDIELYYLYKKLSIYPYRLEHIVSRFLKFDFFQRYRIRKVVRKDYDVLLSFMEGIPVKFHQYLFDRGKKHFSWVHIDLFVNHYTKDCFNSYNAELGIYNRMDKIVSVAKDTKDQFLKRFPVEVDQCVIMNPIDQELINKLAEIYVVEKSKFTISTVGRLVSQKSYDRLIRVAKLLKNDGYDFEIWIIGAGLLETEYLTMVNDLELQDVVKFLGFQSPPYAFVKASDLFISTSSSEGFSLVLCEALCLGVPVISTKTSGPTEILDNSTYGLLCDHDDNSIYMAIKSMIDSPENLFYYKTMAKERRKMFNIAETINQFENLLSE